MWAIHMPTGNQRCMRHGNSSETCRGTHVTKLGRTDNTSTDAERQHGKPRSVWAIHIPHGSQRPLHDGNSTRTCRGKHVTILWGSARKNNARVWAIHTPHKRQYGKTRSVWAIHIPHGSQRPIHDGNSTRTCRGKHVTILRGSAQKNDARRVWAIHPPHGRQCHMQHNSRGTCRGGHVSSS